MTERSKPHVRILVIIAKFLSLNVDVFDKFLHVLMIKRIYAMLEVINPAPKAHVIIAIGKSPSKPRFCWLSMSIIKNPNIKGIANTQFIIPMFLIALL